MKPSYLLVGTASALLLLGGCSSMNQPAASTASTASSAAGSGTIKAAQQSLAARGYNVGTVDGTWGPMTVDAVLRFQQRNGLAETGQLDAATLAKLGISS